MKDIRRLKRKLCSGLISLAFGIVLTLLSAPGHASSVIVNSSSGTSMVSLSEIRAIFSMRLRRWPNGTPVVVFVMKSDSPIHAEFCKAVLNIYPHQLQAAWDRMVYSGTGKAPTVVNTEEEMRALVAATPGAIGYVLDVQPGDTSIKEVTLK